MGLTLRSKYLTIYCVTVTTIKTYARYIAFVYIAVAYPSYLGLTYLAVALPPRYSALYYWLNLFKNAALIITYSCNSRLLTSIAAMRLFLDRFLIGVVSALASTFRVGPFTRRG